MGDFTSHPADLEIQNEDSSSSSDSLHTIGSSDLDSVLSIFDYRDPYILQPMIQAVVDDDLERIRRLVADGNSVNINNNQGQTPLHFAIEFDKKTIFDYLVELEDTRLNAADFSGKTPLIYALCNKDDAHYVKALLTKKVDPNEGRDALGHSALHLSVIRNWVDVFEYLLKRGADVNEKNELKATPLHLACDNNNTAIAKIILEHGEADLTSLDSCLRTPFVRALHKSNGKIQQMLMDFTYGRHIPWLNFELLFEVLDCRSPVLEELVHRVDGLKYHISPGECSLIARKFFVMEPRIFRQFASKFKSAMKDIFMNTRALTAALTFLEFDSLAACLKNIQICFELGLGRDLVNSVLTNFNAIGKMCRFARRTGYDDKKIINTIGMLLLMEGYDPSLSDLCAAYDYLGGNSDLVKLLLNVELARDKKKPVRTVLSYDVTLELPELVYDLMPHQMLLELAEYIMPTGRFRAALERAGHDCSELGVPSLQELARNCFRRHCVDIFPHQKTHIYRTIIKKLPIPKAIEKIIFMEKRIYIFVDEPDL